MASDRIGYLDGFVIPVPTENMEAYAKLARKASKIWMEHGALSYIESAGDDLDQPFGMPFPKLAKVKPGESVVFAYIGYKSKAHRDKVNAKVMADTRMAGMEQQCPFEIKRMAFGGFKVFVSGKSVE